MHPPTPGPPVRTADGISLASWDLGGQGPPLLFLHATGFHGRCWAALAQPLAQHFHCWALDQRGHGASDRSPDLEYGWRHFSDDVAIAIAALELHQPFVVGHSLGGGIALMTEALWPGTFRGIYGYEPIVVDPVESGSADPAGPGNAGVEANSNLMAHLARRRRAAFSSKATALDNYAHKPPFSHFRADVLAAYVDGGFVEAPGGGVTVSCDIESEARVFEAARMAGIRQLLVPSTTPTYLACGDQAPVMGPESLEAIAEQLGGASIQVFAHLGHLGPFENPDRVARAIGQAFAGPGIPVIPPGPLSPSPIGDPS